MLCHLVLGIKVQSNLAELRNAKKTYLHVLLFHSPGTTAKVKLQLLEPIRFVDVQTKNPDVSREMLKRDRTPSSAT